MPNRISLPTQMTIGLVLGLCVGAAFSVTGWDGSWFKPIGQVFINLVRMLVVPLVFFTLVTGAASIADITKLGRVALKTIIFYLVTTGLAISIALILAEIFQPGVGLDIVTNAVQYKEVIPPSIGSILINIIPINPVQALATGNMLQIIFFAILLGFTLSTLGDFAQPMTKIVDIMAEAMIKMTGYVMLYAPIGIFGLMAYTVSMHGFEVLLPLVKLILVMYLASLAQILLVYLPSMHFCGISPLRFFKGLASPLIIAFSTCSSAAALSSNLQSSQRLGASKSVASFSIPLGNTINMDGAAIYMGVAAVFAAEVYGIPLPFDKQLTIVLLAVLASIGSMGVPGAGLIMITMVFTQVGIPLEAIALIAGVDRIIDMARTTINVLGDATAAIFVTKLEGELVIPKDDA